MEQQVLPKDRAASARSRAYAWLGFPNVSQESLRAALRLAPDDASDRSQATKPLAALGLK